MSFRLWLAVGFAAALWQAAPRTGPVTFTRLYDLRPEEGVFAYARISPDGKTLAYASEMPSGTGRMTTTQTVVDLPSKKVLFSEPGIDAYWSLDGKRMIFLSQTGGDTGGVTIRHLDTGAITRRVAPVSLGDYFSWARRDGKDLILTIQSNFYYLDGDMGVMPAGRVPACDGIGVGDRPLISKDGRRISTFVRGAVVVRGLTDCENTVDTGLQGAKADFSWDGRYVAFHVPKSTPRQYEIVVVDLQQKTMRMVTDLPGSSLFPSWTQDGRLCFRYDGADYRGFMMADHVLDVPAKPLPSGGSRIPAAPAWAQVFPGTPAPAHRTNVVMIWASWSAHTPDALANLESARATFLKEGADVGVMSAIEPATRRDDADRLLRQGRITVPEIPLDPRSFLLTEAVNQIPTTLLFRDGRLIDRRLGAQSARALHDWVTQAQR